jgi:hypothetical protein
LIRLGHLVSVLHDQCDLSCSTGIRDRIFHIEFALEFRFLELPPIGGWAAIEAAAKEEGSVVVYANSSRFE